ncbi:hypothetical protein GCM10012285_47800 [Streptomyces kronopolitis]|uniref:Uncharacterized protein n=1 Tax=Streptomyces kronopolitis TaxID=1612435 RepID=A0ABQ2JUN8_9ACTN|nr:hypothetical protein GCM10012285_47800 [Streptomyces kronopolitis]
MNLGICLILQIADMCPSSMLPPPAGSRCREGGSAPGGHPSPTGSEPSTCGGAAGGAKCPMFGADFVLRSWQSETQGAKSQQEIGKCTPRGTDFPSAGGQPGTGHPPG